MAYSSSKIKLHFLLRAINLSPVAFHEGSHLGRDPILEFDIFLKCFEPNSKRLYLSDDQSRIIRIQLDVLKEQSREECGSNCLIWKETPIFIFVTHILIQNDDLNLIGIGIQRILT